MKGMPLKALEGLPHQILAVAVSPDGKLLATSGSEKVIAIWELSSGEQIASLQGHTEIVWSLAFSPDGKTLASGSHDKFAMLWDVDAQRLKAPLPASELFRAIGLGHLGEINSVTFSHDGNILATSGNDGYIILWNTATNKQTATLEHALPVPDISFSPNGETLASAGADGDIRLWDVTSGKIRISFKAHDSIITQVAFSPDGTILASGALDKTVSLWDVSKNQLLTKFIGHAEGITAIAFSPDGKTLATASTDTKIKLWDVARESIGRDSLPPHDERVTAIAFSTDGKMLATASFFDDTVRLWDVLSGNEVSRVGEMQFGDAIKIKCSPETVAFSPTGQTFAVGTNFCTKLFKTFTAQELATLPSGGVRSLAYSPDGKRLVTASSETIDLWNIDVATLGSVDHPMKSADRTIGLAGAIFVDFSPDNKTLLMSFSDGTAKLWDAMANQELGAFVAQDSQAYKAARTRDGKILAVGSVDGTIRLWSVEAQRELARLSLSAPLVKSLGFSHDGKTLAASAGNLATDSQDVTLWNVATGEKLFRLRGHHVLVTGLAFSPTEPLLVTGSYDGSLRIWAGATISDTAALHSD